MQTMGKVMANTAKTMKDVNDRLPVQQMAKDMQEFSRQQAMMDMKGEMVDETLDSMLEVDEGEEDRVIGQILDEIGIETKEKVRNDKLLIDNFISMHNFHFQLSKVPRVRDHIGGTEKEEAKEMSDKDLEKLLAGLRG
jgi:hypothetical protein